MNGHQRVAAAFSGQPLNRLPCLPILHSGLPPMFGLPLGEYFTCAEKMADVIVQGYRTFGYDGVQLSLGVTAEAEALGAKVEQPSDGSPILRQHLLPDLTDDGGLDALRDDIQQRDPAAGGRMPLFFDAVARVVEAIGEEAYVLATLRGPLLMASQLCGVESLLMAMITEPDAVAQVLDLTNRIALHLGSRLLDSGAHGLMLGEATCSPNFISPRLYRDLVAPFHRELVADLRRCGWDHVGLHICGNTAPILGDIIATGVTLVDIDYQVPARRAMELAGGQVVLRGNLDPSSVFRFGHPERVRAATAELCGALKADSPDDPRATSWILSSGCDIPPGTPVDNVQAFTQQAGACGQAGACR